MDSWIDLTSVSVAFATIALSVEELFATCARYLGLSWPNLLDFEPRAQLAPIACPPLVAGFHNWDGRLSLQELAPQLQPRAPTL